MSKRIPPSTACPTNSSSSSTSSSTSSATNSNSARSLSTTNTSASLRTPNSTSATVSTSSLSTSARAAQTNRQSTSASLASANERSNEVPPSINPSSSTTSTSADLTTSTLPVSAASTNDPNSSNSLASLDQNNPLVSNQSPTRDLNNLKSSIEYTLFNRIKKRPISGVLNSDADAELTCPICFDLIDVAHVTKCGHSFCQSCIQTALEHTHRCPKCNTPCSIIKDVFPNFALNQIIERYKEETNTKKCKLSQSTTSTIIDFINSAQDELNIEDVNQILTILSQRKEELKFTSKKVTELLVYDFLKHLQQVKSEELSKIQHELLMVNEDCKQVEDQITVLKANSPEGLGNLGETSSSAKSSKCSSPVPNLAQPSLASICEKTIEQSTNETIVVDVETKPTTTKPVASTNNQTSPNKVQTILANKKRIIHRYFDELSQTYLQSHNRDLKDFSFRDCTKRSSHSIVLDQIRNTVSKITNCSEFRCIASVNYNSDLYSMSSIVSSLDFDRSYEHFAMAGVTKRIKIFDFLNILDRPYGVHYPLYEMTHNAKLSCVSWNRYFRHQLACSDYEGVVTLWDAEQGTLTRSYQEHEKRCWGVQFCEVDPRLLASASDDSKVKIWSTNSDYSLLSIDAKSNVCCVVFKPDSKFHVLFGTADHSIHYYDLRNPKEAVSLFKSHKKAVSYVKFSGENEFVSASTDSNLKMWKLNEGQCVRSFTGHVNEKNFVGLETHNGYIVTGSENNTVYLYCNELSKPMITYKFDDGGFTKKDEGMNDFVSAVCWSNENYLLAANSQGVVKVLELV